MCVGWYGVSHVMEGRNIELLASSLDAGLSKAAECVKGDGAFGDVVEP